MIVKSYLLENNNDFFKDYKSILFYGENFGLKNDFKNIIIKSFKGEFIKKSQEEILKNQKEFYEEMYNDSLFSDKKIFFINDIDDKLLETIKDIENNANKNKIYLFADILDKKSKIRNYFEKSKEFICVPCYQDNIITIKNIIKNKLKNFNSLNDEIIKIIADNCNLNRYKLNNEIEKIKSFFLDLKIEKGKLKEILNLKINDDFNALNDQAFNGNKLLTNTLLSETVFSNDRNIIYINLINQKTNRLLDILKKKKGDSIEEFIDQIKPPIFWKEKPIIVNQIKKWNIKKLNKISEHSYKVEIKLKSQSALNQSLFVKKLIIDICNIANAA